MAGAWPGGFIGRDFRQRKLEKAFSGRRFSGGGLGPAQGFAPVAQGLRDVDAGHFFLAVEVGERPGDPERPVVASRAQGERVRRITQERQA